MVQLPPPTVIPAALYWLSSTHAARAGVRPRLATHRAAEKASQRVGAMMVVQLHYTESDSLVDVLSSPRGAPRDARVAGTPCGDP